MKYSVLFSILIFLAACSAKIYVPLQADVDRVNTKYPGYSLAAMQEGKTIFEQNCSACHPLKKPTKYSEAQWKEIVPEMVQKVNGKAKKEQISPAQQELVLKYLVARRTAAETAKK